MLSGGALSPWARRCADAAYRYRRVYREHHHQADPAGGNADVAVHQLEDGARGRDRYHAADRLLIDGGELDQDALEEQQSGERDDERWDVEPRDQGPLQVADSRRHTDAADDPEPPRKVDGGSDQLGDHHPADGEHEPDRQVDLRQDQSEDLGRPEQDVDRRLVEQVDQIPVGTEPGSLDLEEDDDDDQSGDDGQRAALPALDPSPLRAQVVAERVGQHLGRGGYEVGFGLGGGSLVLGQLGREWRLLQLGRHIGA